VTVCCPSEDGHLLDIDADNVEAQVTQPGGGIFCKSVLREVMYLGFDWFSEL